MSISLSNIDHVKTLKTNLRASIDTDAGKEVMKFLEELCGWYDFTEVDPNQIMINTGKRQVLATLKTLLKCSPEEIVAIIQKGELSNG